VLHGVSKRPPHELAAGREVFGPPRCIEIVEERLWDLWRDRGHIGVLVDPRISVGHTSVLV